MKIIPKRNYLFLLCMCLVLMFTLMACGKSKKNDNTVVDSNNALNDESNNDVNDNDNDDVDGDEKSNDAVEETDSEEPIEEPEKEPNLFLEKYQETGELPSLAELYKDKFYVGVALAQIDFSKVKKDLVASQFNSLTCENEMKPDAVLDRNATIALGDEESVAINMNRALPAILFAEENGIKIRYHTLVWHAQTPDWFFNVGFKDGGERVTRDVMIARMESFIREVMEYMNTNHPGLIYAWDVVNEAISPGDGREDGIRVTDNRWFEVVGPDYVELAFTFARKYAAEDQKLFYNDYQTYNKSKMFYLIKMIEDLQEKGLIDGIGMQDHMDLTTPGILDYQYTINKYTDMGLEIQVTELDINTTDNSEEGQKKLASRYKAIMTIILNCIERNDSKITSITLWGLSDNRSWLNQPGTPNYPLLFDKDLNPKYSYFGMAMDDSISIAY